jgi:hypothetical protein
MKFSKFALLLALAATPSFSQTLVERPFLVRAETTSYDPYSGMTHVCVLVYPDGKYRLEKSYQDLNGNKPGDHVYVDTLPADSVKQLQAAVDDGKFADIKTADPKGGIVQNMDTLMVSVPREHALQNISFMTVNERRPFDKELKPFLNWMKEVQKRKVQPAKNEASNNCSAPQVLYRNE